MASETARSTALQRKNSLKRRPSMKHTKCSILRMLKANPLLQFDEEAKKELGITNSLLRQYGLTEYISKSSELASDNHCDIQELPNKITNMKPPNNSSNRCTLSTMHRRSVKSVPSKRRSVSEERFDGIRHLGVLSKDNVSLSQSMEDINSQPFVNLQLSPIMQEPDIFKTPKGNHRCTIHVIQSTSKRHLHNLQTSTPAKCNLKSRLNLWLAKHGKSLESFHHLKCFGIPPPPPPNDEENKKNIEINLRRNSSYESLCIIQECGSSTGSISGSHQVEIDYESIAKDALQDLYNLIQDGYPHDQATGWLNMIHDRCKNLDEEPYYWKCRGALEQCGQNIINAVECYRTAIIKGAEVHSVDQSLEQLLQKFSLLDTASIGDESNDRAKVIMEARNVFKSSIIRYAVQERDMRTN